MKNYYKILDIEKDSDSIAIKKAYKLLAKKFHPDLNKNESSQAKFIEINEAYTILGDEFERIKYNQLFYAQASNDFQKKQSKNKYKNIFLVNYKYYAFALILLILFFSYFQFKLKTIYENQELTNLKGVEKEINKDKVIDLSKEKTEDIVDKEKTKEEIDEHVKSVGSQLKPIKIALTNIKNTDKKIKIVKNSKNKIVVGNKREAINNLPISMAIPQKAKKDSIVNSKIEMLVKNDTKKEKTDIVVKTKTDQHISNNTRVNTAEKVRIKAKNIIITNLQHTKQGKYKIPKKIHKANSFKVEVEVFNNSVTKINNEVKIMLVILNSSGKTLKIAVKNVDFSKKDSNLISFYEKIEDKLMLNEQYSFLLFANKTLITRTKKII